MSIDYEEIHMYYSEDDDIEYENEYDNDENENHLANKTIKKLKIICEYYGLKKKGKKDELIQQIELFENDPKHIEIVSKRKLFWYYMNELKHDKILKKFILF